MTGSKLEIIRAYLRAIETGDTEAVVASFAPGAVVIEWPNRLKSQGGRRSVDKLAPDFEQGKAMLSSQSYDILHHAEAGNYLIMEVLWRGVLAMDLGSLPAGSEMAAHCAFAFEFENDRIIAQRNYDCFEPF